MKVFRVSNYENDQARKFRKENGAFKTPATTQKSRVCMDISKAGHYLVFVFIRYTKMLHMAQLKSNFNVAKSKGLHMP